MVTAHAHSPGFLAIVEDARSRVQHFGVDEFLKRLQSGERYVLIDVREDGEWANGHLPSAHHMGRGILERDIELALAETDTPIVVYCDDGLRSVLAAESLMKMGYTNVTSLDGGWRGWTERGLPSVTPDSGA